VLINLPQIQDEQFVREMKEKCTSMEQEAEQMLTEVLTKVREKIDSLSA
jgi:formiminotetrahydrofolate cyclodeaminase